jgi:hypothetical protein
VKKLVDATDESKLSAIEALVRGATFSVIGSPSLAADLLK